MLVRVLLVVTVSGACAALTSCESSGGFAPPDGTPIVAPSHFRSLWRTVEACSGQMANFHAIDWYSAPGALAGGDGETAGWWWSAKDRIYINEDYLDDANVVRHEMLHAIVRGSSHSTEFVDECGGLVTCVGECITEAGPLSPLPTASAAVIAADELEVDATIIVPLSGEEGWTTVVVSARNPRTEPVWIDLSARPGIQFECLLDGFYCAAHQIGGDARVPIRAGATLREAFVFPVLPGVHEVRAAFNAKTTPAQLFEAP